MKVLSQFKSFLLSKNFITIIWVKINSYNIQNLIFQILTTQGIYVKRFASCKKVKINK